MPADLHLYLLYEICASCRDLLCGKLLVPYSSPRSVITSFIVKWICLEYSAV